MNGANRKAKLSKYQVTITREIEHTAVVEVEARNAEEAEEVGLAVADAADSRHWREGDVLSQTVKAKIVRGQG